MKETPIILNTKQVRAVLHGRKMQHRVPVKFPFIDRDACCELSGNELAGEISAGNYLNSKFGKPGDRLWVRETYATHGDESQFVAHYKADNLNHFSRPGMGFMSPVTMPRWASRITLEITGIRVERLNSISQEDAQAEGMELTGWRPTYSDPDSGGECQTPYDNFAELWESIYGEDSWQTNPWVWVIEFNRVEATND